eukprot:9068840-Pyramimonas_sp.AAC.1
MGEAGSSPEDVSVLVGGVLEGVVLKVAAMGELGGARSVGGGAEGGQQLRLGGEQQRPIVRCAPLHVRIYHTQLGQHSAAVDSSP